MLNGPDNLLELRDFSLTLKRKKTPLPLLKGLSFSLRPGESMAIVGESGCGKTLTARSIMKLYDERSFEVNGGQILFKGRDILGLSEAELRELRGKQMAMIFQEPMTALNPVFTIGDQIEEALTLHLDMGKKEALMRAVELLEQVGIPEAEYRIHSYPHELSGGMRQRAMIAMAISCNPTLLIADEPTTALDVTVQAQIMELLERLREEIGMALILVTHDLGIVWSVAERVIIMYAGYIVENSPVNDLFKDPLHPYTQGLLRSIPQQDVYKWKDKGRRRLDPIPGNVPAMNQLGPGCPFMPRCPKEMKVCKEILPPLTGVEGSDLREVRCHLYP